jgi:transposase InsO family protein
MDIHQNARLLPRARAALAEEILKGRPVRAVAAGFRVSERTARKWLIRFQREGVYGMGDRSSRPRHSPFRTAPDVERRVEQLRRQRFTGAQIARETGLSRATVFRTLKRLGLNRLSRLEPALPIQRYEHAAPGDLIHLDIKRLGRFTQTGHRITGDRTQKSRGAGWEFLHVSIDDHSRVALTDLFADQRTQSAVTFLKSVVARYRALGVCVSRVLTDNGSCYRSRQFRTACRHLGLKHIFTRPYTPRTNGKAERFIQTALREWAYSTAYNSSEERACHLPHWLHRYNWHRPHGSLSGQVPVSRLGLSRNNLLRLHN